MRSFTIACSVMWLFAGMTAQAEESVPEMPKPQKEHAWLAQFAGDWDYETEAKPPGHQETLKFNGEEHSRMVGGFWLVGENKGEMMGVPFTGIMTLGYDSKSKSYIGTWIRLE